MRLTRLGTFFREASTALSKSPELRASLRQATAHALDRFELPRRPSPPAITPEQRASNEQFVRSLYADLLHREPDAGGLAAHLSGLDGGMSRAQIRQVFLDSAELAELQRPRPAPAPVEPAPAPAPVEPAPAPRTYREPGAALSTVPAKAEYLDVPVDMRNSDEAIRSTARWVRTNRPGYFDKGDDRAVAFAMMTEVIGVLRAHGYDAHRVVNHPSRPMGDGMRYGSDAVVLNGKIFDIYGAWGDPGRGDPQLAYVGDYAADRLRE